MTMQRFFWVILAFCVLLSFWVGNAEVEYISGLKNIFNHLAYGETLDSNGIILYEIRLPRILLALLVGASLSGSGAVMQNIFRNPLIDPFLLGVSSGAAFGCALCIGFLGQGFLGLFAFGGAVGASFLIVFFASFVRGSQISLVLIGIIFSSFLGALSGLVKYFVAPEKAQAITIWLLGSLSLSTWRDVILLSVVMVVCFIPLFLLRFRINALALSDLECLSLGINPKALRIVCIVLVSFVCGIAVSVSGTIGWVGLMVPHFARMLVGANLRLLLPSSMLLGGIILLLMDFLSKNLTSNDLPVGAVSAIIGAPLFLAFLFMARSRIGG